MHFKTMLPSVAYRTALFHRNKTERYQAKIVPPADPSELARTVNKYIPGRNRYTATGSEGGDYVNQFTCFPDESVSVTRLEVPNVPKQFPR